MPEPHETTAAFLVRRDERSAVKRGVEPIRWADLPSGEVSIRVVWSSANYKDAMAAEGHPGVARNLPHIPGIDAAGYVIDSSDDRFQPGQAVIVTGNELGAGHWGGWCGWIRVPGDWVVACPDRLSLKEAMVYGTAGFTAAQCLLRLQQHDVVPDSGPIAVTGASGGVGCLAVQLLAKLGYQAVAVTGKSEAVDWLKRLGAHQVVSRSEVTAGDQPERPLAKARWAGAIDTVGGATLTALVRATQLNGCVACCGLVGGVELPLTVYPFILRGVVLAGVTSQNAPLAIRREIWQRLADSWRVDVSQVVARTVGLDGLESTVQSLLAGRVQGRTLVAIGANEDSAV